MDRIEDLILSSILLPFLFFPLDGYGWLMAIKIKAVGTYYAHCWHEKTCWKVLTYKVEFTERKSRGF
jgi:hypothetical protein